MSNVHELKRAYTLRIRPIHKAVLKLLSSANKAVERDPVQTYGDLLTAAVHAARNLNLTADQIAVHVQSAIAQCDKAVSARPDIFGPHL